MTKREAALFSALTITCAASAPLTTETKPPAIQSQRQESCHTKPQIAATCDTTVWWPHAFPDLRYTVSCSIQQDVGEPRVVYQRNATPAAVVVRITTADGAAAMGILNCIAIKDTNP